MWLGQREELGQAEGLRDLKVESQYPFFVPVLMPECDALFSDARSLKINGLILFEGHLALMHRGCILHCACLYQPIQNLEK